MQIFLRRAGKIIGSFDREEYLAQYAQGGVNSDDEWMPIGGESWRIVGHEAPFLSNNERRRQAHRQMEQEIANAFHDLYHYRMWSARIMARNDHCEGHLKERLDSSEFGFIEEIALSGFGAFQDEHIIRLFHVRDPRVRVLTELATVWVAGNGEGKTSLGLALEMIRDVALGKKISTETLRYLRKDTTAKVRVNFRTRHGLQSAELTVSRGHPVLHASQIAIDGLRRITFVSDDHLYRNKELVSQMDNEKIAGVMSRAKAFMPNLKWSGDGVDAWPAMREALAVSGMENRTSFSLLCLLHEAEDKGQILVLENPLGQISRPHYQRLLSLMQESPRRGARQVFVLSTDDLSFYKV